MTLKILVVDDASFVRDLVKRTLRQQIANVETIEAGDGERGIALVKQQKPNLILSDWEMPKVSGEEFLRWIRSEPEFENIPFIIISSRGDRNHIVEAAQSGVNDYITKPFSAEELTRKVMKQLKRIGYDPKIRDSAKKQMGAGQGTLEALTGKPAEKQVSPAKPSTEPTAPKPAAKAPAKKGALLKAPPVPGSQKGGGLFKGRAQLRFSDSTCVCEIKDLSLQAVNVVTDRPEVLPRLFDQAAVDLENTKGEVVARLNAYVHSIQAVTPHPESEKIKVIVRFVDKDPAKMEALSKAIAGG